jgi:hypothetical protein
MSKPELESKTTPRFFKTAWFAKAAAKEKIADDALCKATGQVLDGKADDLGGGVYKKRLNKNLHRSIILGKGLKYWVYVYLYAKKNRDNIVDNERKHFENSLISTKGKPIQKY